MRQLSTPPNRNDSYPAAFAGSKPEQTFDRNAQRELARVGEPLPPAQDEVLHGRLADPSVIEVRVYCWGGAVLRHSHQGVQDRGVQIEIVPVRLWARLGAASSRQIVTRADWQRCTLVLARNALGRLPGGTTLAHGAASGDALGHCLVSLFSRAPASVRSSWIDLLLGGPAMADLLQGVERAAARLDAPARALSEGRLAVLA